MSKPHGAFFSNSYNLSAADIGISSQNKSGAARLSICADGSSNNGDLNIRANGGARMASGNAAVVVSADGAGSASLDAGPTGTAMLSAGNPAVPQTITLDGESASIKILNGVLDVCPCIELTPTSIKLSVGPTSSIEITPEGVSIKGLNVDLAAIAKANLSGALVDVSGTGMTSVAGGLIKIG
jgi:hypothetical protein